MSYTLRITIKLPCSQERAWAAIADWESQGNWMLQTKVWSELDQDRTVKNGKGVLIFAFTGIFPKLYPKLKLGILDTMEVTNWKPPHLCEVMHIGRIIRGTGKFELKKVRGGTIFYWQEEVIAPALILLFAKPALLIGVWLSLRRFARQVSA